MARGAEVIVVGGGQSGLVAGYYLARAGIPFQILDEEPRLGEAWRRRWDSLELFTVAQYCSLPGLRFPGRKGHFPGKDAMADYIEAYAHHFDLPVQLDTRVSLLEQTADGYRLQTSAGDYEARHVIVATGAYRLPRTPQLAEKLSDQVHQVHTGVYRNPSELPPGTVVVVGAANSGAQIAPEIADAGHRTLLSQGSKLPHFPRKFLFKGLHWYGDKFGLIEKPLIGERDRLHKKTILVGPSLKKISRRHGVELVERTVDAQGRTLRFEDGQEVEVDAVVWATGFRYDYSWIDVPILDSNGIPAHDRGVTDAPGLYFLGMQCQYSYGSGLIWWVKDDASYLVDHLQARRRDPAYR